VVSRLNGERTSVHERRRATRRESLGARPDDTRVFAEYVVAAALAEAVR
jgi:hypothetical protein